MSQADADVWIDTGHELLQLQLRVADHCTAVAATGADHLQRWMPLMGRARVGLLPVKVQTRKVSLQLMINWRLVLCIICNARSTSG